MKVVKKTTFSQADRDVTQQSCPTARSSAYTCSLPDKFTIVTEKFTLKLFRHFTKKPVFVQSKWDNHLLLTEI